MPPKTLEKEKSNSCGSVASLLAVGYYLWLWTEGDQSQGMLLYLPYLGFFSLILLEHARATIKTRKYVLSGQKGDVWPKLMYKITNFNRVPFVGQKCCSYFRHFDKIDLHFRFLNVVAPVSEIRRIVHALSKGAPLVTSVIHPKMRLSSAPPRMRRLSFILDKVWWKNYHRFQRTALKNILQTTWILSRHHLFLSM